MSQTYAYKLCMCFVFDMHVQFKLCLHVFHAYHYIMADFVLLFNKID